MQKLGAFGGVRTKRKRLKCLWLGGLYKFNQFGKVNGVFAVVVFGIARRVTGVVYEGIYDEGFKPFFDMSVGIAYRLLIITSEVLLNAFDRLENKCRLHQCGFARIPCMDCINDTIMVR